jgi:hypothetical protein
MVKALLEKSPAHAFEQILHPMVASAAMKDGSVLDQMILTPKGKKKYSIMPESLAKMNGNSKDVQNWKKLQKFEGLIPLKPSEHKTLQNCVDRVFTHPGSRELLCNNKAQTQVAGFATHDESGLRVKGLVDLDPDPGGPILIDCKKAESAHESDFMKQVIKFKYYLQAAWYLYIWNRNSRDKSEWKWIVYEAAPPHGVSLISCPPEMIKVGVHEMGLALTEWKKCQDSGEWPAYSDEEVEGRCPYWFLQMHSRLLGPDFG